MKISQPPVLNRFAGELMQRVYRIALDLSQDLRSLGAELKDNDQNDFARRQMLSSQLM
jgi:hypothetical protein